MVSKGRWKGEGGKERVQASPKRGRTGKRDFGEDLLDNRIERGCVLGYHALRPWPTIVTSTVHVGRTGWAGGGGACRSLVRLGCVHGQKNGVLGGMGGFGWPYPVPMYPYPVRPPVFEVTGWFCGPRELH